MTEQTNQLLRMCQACRKMFPRETLFRLTVDREKGEVFLNVPPLTKHLHGRSTYLCRKTQCVERALKGNKLKGALEGRRAKKQETAKRATIKWPLEPQLIHTLQGGCTESPESCHNTRREEGS